MNQDATLTLQSSGFHTGQVLRITGRHDGYYRVTSVSELVPGGVTQMERMGVLATAAYLVRHWSRKLFHPCTCNAYASNKRGNDGEEPR